MATGKPWTPLEIEFIVSDYLEMLDIELRGDPVNKAERNRALRQLIDRTRTSIEYKHRNISAVLAELGLPYVKGYKPARNYQRALFKVLEDRLVPTGMDERLANRAVGGIVPASGLQYQPAPTIQPRQAVPDPEVLRIIRRFDPAGRDARARELGKAGEDLVYRSEKDRLSRSGRPDLAEKVRWIARDDGDGAGFDVLSFSMDGRERWLEVKTTNGPSTTPFWISENERRVAEGNPDVFRLTRIHDFSTSPAGFRLTPPLTNHLHLAPTEYRATLL